jgi:hypothetical protein
MCESAEEIQTSGLIIDRYQFIERGAGAESFFANALQDDHFCVRVVSDGTDRFGQLLQDLPRQRVALRMEEFNAGNALL